MSNNEQGMSKEEVLRTNVLPLLPWTFLVGHSSFNFPSFLCASVINSRDCFFAISVLG